MRELSGLDPAALLTVKKLIRAGLNERNNRDAVNLRESYGELPLVCFERMDLFNVWTAQAARFASGVPLERFGQIARKEIKHKL